MRKNCLENCNTTFATCCARRRTRANRHARTENGGAKSAPGKFRNNWSAPEATVERIQSIREETDAGTDTEVIKKSAAMLSVGRPAPEGGNAYKDDKERSVIFA